MRQRNDTGYPIVVQPPDGSDRAPFDLAPGEETDYPDPIAGCVAVEEPPAKAAAKKTPAKTADGGDPA